MATEIKKDDSEVRYNFRLSETKIGDRFTYYNGCNVTITRIYFRSYGNIRIGYRSVLVIDFITDEGVEVYAFNPQ